MKDKSPKLLIIITALVILCLMSAHTAEINNLPGVTAEGGGVSVNAGDYHYTKG